MRLCRELRRWLVNKHAKKNSESLFRSFAVLFGGDCLLGLVKVSFHYPLVVSQIVVFADRTHFKHFIATLQSVQSVIFANVTYQLVRRHANNFEPHLFFGLSLE